MIGQNLGNNFILQLSDGWVYPEVEKDLREHFRQAGGHFRNVLDYLNHTIQSGTLPGISDNGTDIQTYAQGHTRSFAGSLKPDAIIEKKLTITFQLQNNFLNWIVLYNQFLAYYDREKGKSNEKRAFLPPIYLLIMDEMKNIICKCEYTEIQFEDMPPLEFLKANVGLDTKSFDVRLRFNNFKIEFYFDRVSNNTKKEYKY